jgi:hypothetical protein
MPFANLVRWSGPAAMVGGALWVVVFVLFALRPSGPELQPPYRSFEGLGIAVVLSLLLIVAGMVGLHARSKEAYGGLGTAGFVLALVGAALSIVSFGSWPLIFVGSYALMLGSLLVGVAAFGAKTLPRWGAVVLWVGSAAFFVFNTETSAAWFAVPYGVSWVAVGYLLWYGTASEQPSRVR